SKIFKHDAQGAGFIPNAHVDLGIDFKRFISSDGDSYILEGIRGTGKTHIFKMIINEIGKDFQKYRIIPAFVTIAGAPEISKNDPKFFRVYLYTSIIKDVCKFITNNKELIKNTKNDTLLKKIKGIFSIINENNDFESNINYILNLANNIISELYDNPDKIVTRLSSSSISDTKASLEIKPLAISVGDSKSNNDEQIKEYTTLKLADIYGLDVLLSFLRLVKNLLNINYTYLLLDECSESNEMMQKEVFRLCKQIRAFCSNNETLSKPDVAFIVAVYPPHSTYYPATSKGDEFNFQPGHDCSPEYLEIDELNDEFESFFKQLMENRLKLNNGGPSGLLEVFENEEPILLAAYASGGVPRRFLEIIKQAYNQLSRDFGAQTSDIKKISSSYVVSAIGQVVEGPSILNDSTLTDDNKIILERIIKKFVQRNKSVETKSKGISESERTPITIYFTTAAKSSGELGNLISVGIIHDKKRSRSRKSSIASWQGSGILCSIDIGVAIHRGIVPRTSSRILEICQKDIKQAAHRGFTYTLDMRLEEESLDLEYEQTKEFIQFLEKRLLDLDKALMDKSIPESHYNQIVQRTNSMLEPQRKKLEKIQGKIDERKRASDY
ncbi:hypothetical protein J4209_04750, partial [Candidatus Woesearchaeota archaeon]|nr:hypothetical protein [Candidatus Woesearchaeota archaeon]